MNADLSLFEKVVSAVLLLSFLYSGLHCVGYLDHILKSVILYDDELIKNENNGGTAFVAIVIPTLNEDPDMVKRTVIDAKSLDYQNYEVFLIDSSTDLGIRDRTEEMSKKLNINYI